MKSEWSSNVLDQTLLILAHFEEVVVFAQLLDRALAVRTEPIVNVFFSPESLVECAVPASIFILVNQLPVEELLKVSLN